MLKTYRDRAIVLRRYKLGEADRIVVFLSENNGQIRAVAKGARKTTSRFGGRLEPFTVVDAQFYRGRGDLDTVTQVETVAALSEPLTHNYEVFTLAQVMMDIAEKLSTTDVDSENHYRLLYGALASMARGEHAPAATFTSYILRALHIAGWPPRLDQCGSCNARQTTSLIPNSTTAPTKTLQWLSIPGGGAYCDSCHPADAHNVGAEQLASLYWLLKGNWVKVTPLQPSTIDHVIRYAQWHIENTIKSLSVLAQGAL